VAGVDQYALVDVDDSIIEVHGYAKAGSGYGCASRSAAVTHRLYFPLTGAIVKTCG